MSELNEIVEEKAEQLLKLFRDSIDKSKDIRRLWGLVRDGTVTYEQANEFAKLVGRLLGESLSGEALKLSYEDALALINAPYNHAFEYVARYSCEAQRVLNEAAGLGVNAVKPKLFVDRVSEVARRLSEVEDVMQILQDESERFAMSAVDDTIRDNVEFHESLGFAPMIERRYEGPHREHTNHKDGGDMVDCEWCLNLAGMYAYSEVKDRGNEIYMRHKGCRCEVLYTPRGRGSRARSGWISGNSYHWTRDW